MKKATLIIGAGSGLSASLARRFAEDGNRIILAARNMSSLNQLAKETDALAVQCDATQEADIINLFNTIDDAGFSLSTMIYNAGAYTRGAVTELESSDVRRLIDVNAVGAFLAARECTNRMQRDGGSMLFTGASAGIKGYANSSAFAMGKFALRGLCQSLARELAPQNIHVAHFVIDGLIYSPDRGAPYDDLQKCLDPKAIAETYFQIAAQDRSAWTWELELRPWLESF
ncbi:SDR family NAD(P)-dependent oxidoreductase [Sphingorhabdus sp. Alg231-15]|uniref:SDR family NAD(P)-dependent oxidoreductase n=1 Tax=Sphingorhabdus sp. Alg231-15 TaxID=1922222 RepID=UPI000D54ECE6